MDITRLMAEAVGRHGVKLDANDPAMVIVTLNGLMLEEAVRGGADEIREAAKEFEAAAPIRLGEPTKQNTAERRARSGDSRQAKRCPIMDGRQGEMLGREAVVCRCGRRSRFCNGLSGQSLSQERHRPLKIKRGANHSGSSRYLAADSIGTR